jgi:hypothetical protein
MWTASHMQKLICKRQFIVVKPNNKYQYSIYRRAPDLKRIALKIAQVDAGFL